MLVEGTWKVTVESPMGPMTSALVLASADGALTGTQNDGKNHAIDEGKIDGSNVFWKTDTTKPMPMKLEFSGVVDGSQMKGIVDTGLFGSFPFTGVKE